MMEGIAILLIAVVVVIGTLPDLLMLYGDFMLWRGRRRELNRESKK